MWIAQKDFIQTCWFPVVQGDTEGSFIPFHEHFTSVGNNFVRTQENVRTQEGSSVPSIWLDIHNILGYMLHLDCSVKDDNGEPTMVGTYSWRLVMTPTFKGVFATILNVWTAKELDPLLGIRVVMWF